MPEAQKVAAWVAAIVAAARAGHMTGPVGRHPRASFTAVRSLQKLECGRLLASRVGLSTAWYPTISASDEDVITASAFGAAVT